MHQPPGLTALQRARTRSISAENPTGAPGQGGRAERGSHSTAYASSDLPIGWKKSPCIDLAGHETRELANISGSGLIQHIWMTTLPAHWRKLVLRFYWDQDPTPAIEVPLGDFFCQGWQSFAQVNSLPIAVNPAGGLNSYWEMPFVDGARVTVTNLGAEVVEGFFYQITWAEKQVDDDAVRLHAQWRRSDPLDDLQPHTLVEGITGRGHYVGTYLAWESHHPGWWGEGEVKFYLDDDQDFPTICGTGTEDYFGGAWAFEHPTGRYGSYSTPYLGMPQVIEPDGFYDNQQRFGLYRWHLVDPICFETGLRATVQAMGFRSMVQGQERYRSLRDDIASVAWWYAEPGSTVQPAPDLTLDLLDLS